MTLPDLNPTKAPVSDRRWLAKIVKLIRDAVETRLAALEAGTGVAAAVAGVSAGTISGANQQVLEHVRDGLMASIPIGGGVLAETMLQREGIPGTISAVELKCPTALVADDTNNVTITVRRRTNAGVATTIVAKTTNVAGGGFSAFAWGSLGSLAGTSLIATDDVSVQVAVAGSGTIPAGSVLRVKYAGT